MKNSLKKIFLLSILLLCAACSSHKATTDNSTITVTAEPIVTTLYFNSSTKPLQTFNISAPVDGTVSQMYFSYGAEVSKNKLLMTINSPQVVTDYQSALGDYLKAKRDYTDNQTQMQGNTTLHNLGMISDNDYTLAQSQNYSSQLAYTEARRKLELVLEKLGVDINTLENLDISDFKTVSKYLAQPVDAIKIVAPANGVALMPQKSANASETSDMLTVGSQVKNGQSLLMIGDRSGLAFDAKISEIYIDEVKIGQPVTITGDAFPNVTLQGQVSEVGRQAASDQEGTAPTFPVRIIVPKITDEQRNIIHIGMSAKIELQITKPVAIKIPLSAVFTEQGKNKVYLIDKNGDKVAVPVITGRTTEDDVEIQSGLKSGDAVVTNASAD